MRLARLRKPASKPLASRRRLLLAASLAAYALGAYGGSLAVKGALHGLVYPAWLAALSYVGALHGVEGTMAVVALAPLLALSGYMIVVAGVLLTGSWPAALASAPQLAAAALSSAAVYASSYAAARAAVGGGARWEAEGEEGEERGAAQRGGVFKLANQWPPSLLSRAVGGWLGRLRQPRRAGARRGRRGGRPL